MTSGSPPYTAMCAVGSACLWLIGTPRCSQGSRQLCTEAASPSCAVVTCKTHGCAGPGHSKALLGSPGLGGFVVLTWTWGELVPHPALSLHGAAVAWAEILAGDLIESIGA